MKNINVEYGHLKPSPFLEHLKDRKLHLCLFNRATYSRSKILIETLAQYPNVKLTLVCSSALLMAKYGSAIEYIKRNHPNCTIEMINEMPMDSTGLSSAQLVGNLIVRLSGFFYSEKPDAVLVLGDRFETWAPAIAGSLLNIPVIHFQGGEITGNIDDKVRHSITQIADYHFVSTSCAKDYLVEMGQEFKRIYLVGCPGLDILAKNRINRKISKRRYILSIFHPETENVKDAFYQTRVVMEACLEYCYEKGARCIWYYPNPDPGRAEIIRFLDEVKEEHSKFIEKATNLEPEQFLEQLASAQFIVGNSSCGIREASRMGVPAINVGERQRLRERGMNCMDVPEYDKGKILRVMKKQAEMKKYSPSHLYGSGQSSARIAEYLARMDFTLKGHLSYPLMAKFRDRHFGEKRLAFTEGL